jgi:hypothetical protein
LPIKSGDDRQKILTFFGVDICVLDLLIELSRKFNNAENIEVFFLDPGPMLFLKIFSPKNPRKNWRFDSKQRQLMQNFDHKIGF